MADAQAEVALLRLGRQLTFLGMIIQTQHLYPFDLCFCMFFFGHLSCASYSLVHRDIHKGVKHNPSMGSHAQEAKLHGHVEPLADASAVPRPCPLVPLATWCSLLQTAGLTQSPWYLTKPVVQSPRLSGCWPQPSMEAKALLCFIIASNSKPARCLWKLHVYQIQHMELIF